MIKKIYIEAQRSEATAYSHTAKQTTWDSNSSDLISEPTLLTTARYLRSLRRRGWKGSEPSRPTGSSEKLPLRQCRGHRGEGLGSLASLGGTRGPWSCGGGPGYRPEVCASVRHRRPAFQRLPDLPGMQTPGHLPAFGSSPRAAPGTAAPAVGWSPGGRHSPPTFSEDSKATRHGRAHPRQSAPYCARLPGARSKGLLGVLSRGRTSRGATRLL